MGGNLSFHRNEPLLIENIQQQTMSLNININEQPIGIGLDMDIETSNDETYLLQQLTVRPDCLPNCCQTWI